MIKMILLAILLLAVFFISVMVIDCNRFVVRKYECRDQRLQKPLKLVQLSDLHNRTFGAHNERLLRAICRQEPDVIVVSGDMYTSRFGSDMTSAKELLLTLAKEFPIYYANGNHEQKTKDEPEEFGTLYEDYRRELAEAGVCFLSNESAYLPEYNLRMYGLEIDREYYRKFRTQILGTEKVQEYLGTKEEASCGVLIAHNPDFFADYAAWGADLVLSGHVHGGLMRLPFLGGVIAPSMKLFPKYDGGRFEEGTGVMILSRGLGTHTLPIRIFNPGELVVVKLTP